ncbi:MAG: hypothetical protein QOE92_299 [Chloroflexota bacterium]|jgi:hypothetical protein|nr:hypothetical protein [Chloroflexota bacterium]
MKQESSEFTSADVPRFFDQLLEIDMRQTAARLEAASDRMQELAARIPDTRSGDAEWNAKEVLAHVAVLSRAYGVFAYMIANGRLREMDLGAIISQRDAYGEELAARPIPEIVAEAVKQHQRTLKFMASATTEQFKTRAKTEHGDIPVDHILRLPLVVHLEDHLDQIERLLDGAAGAGDGAAITEPADALQA